jgi:hypothetical protein
LFRLAGYGVTPLDAGAPLAWIMLTLPDANLGDSTAVTLDAVRLNEATALVKTTHGRVVVGTSIYLPFMHGSQEAPR